MTRSRSRRRAACNAVRNATWSATLHRTCLRHIPISHRSRVTRHLPADIGHGNGWILLSDSTNQRRAMAGYCYQILTNQRIAMAGYCYQILTNQRRAMAGYCYQILTNQRRAMAGYCYQILTNQSVPPMRGTDGIKGTAPSFLLISFCDTYPTPRLFGKES